MAELARQSPLPRGEEGALSDDRPIRDRLESLQREVRELARERELLESHAFVSARKVLVAGIDQLARDAEVLELQNDTTEHARATLSTEVQRLEVELRAAEQRDLSSFLIVVALCAAGGAAWLLARRVPAEAVTALAAFSFGWLLLGRWGRPSGASLPRVALPLIGVWIGSSIALALAVFTLGVSAGRQSDQTFNHEHRWLALLLPSALLVVAAFTSLVGESKGRGKLVVFVATCAAPLSMQHALRAIVEGWYDQRDVMELVCGALAPVIFVAFRFVRSKPRPIITTVLVASLMIFAAYSNVLAATLARPYMLRPIPILAVAIEASMGCALLALCLPGKARWAALICAGSALAWAAVSATMLSLG